MEEQEILERINNGEKLELTGKEMKLDESELAEVFKNLKIRKLTERECFRLMGMKDCDIDLIIEHQTTDSCYHLAGDSIVTTCLMAIFSKMVGIDWQTKFNVKEWWNK